MKHLCSAVLLVVFTTTAGSAQEWVLGVGVSDFGDQGQDSATLDIEYRHTPFVNKRLLSVALGTNLAVTAEGDVFLGAGLWSRWQWQSGWFIDNSIMPGLFEEGTPGNSLGSAFEIRSLLGVGYQFDHGGAVSVAISHRSNASLASDNPGMNVYSVRYHRSF